MGHLSQNHNLRSLFQVIIILHCIPLTQCILLISLSSQNTKILSGCQLMRVNLLDNIILVA